MVGSVEKNSNDGHFEVGGKDGSLGNGRGGETAVKLGLSGCHDTTLAAVLSSLGAFQNEQWPPYTSHIALELFKQPSKTESKIPEKPLSPPKTSKGWFAGLFGGNTASKIGESPGPSGIARKQLASLSEFDRSKLDGYFVRIRFNDRVMSIPGCKPTGKHLEGDESFCTLVSLLSKFWFI